MTVDDVLVRGKHYHLISSNRIYFGGRMARSANITVKVEPDVKATAEAAAKEDGRTLSQYLERVIIKHLCDTGWLPLAAPAPVPGTPKRKVSP